MCDELRVTERIWDRWSKRERIDKEKELMKLCKEER